MRPSSSFPPAAEPRHPAIRRAWTGRRPRTAGFSLVEVLAALILTVLLVAALMPFAGGVATRWMTGQRRVEEADVWMRATVRLADDTARAIPLTIGADQNQRVVFRGSEREILFVRPSLSAAASSALEVVALTVERTDEGEALVRRSTPYDPGVLDRETSSFEASTTIASGPYRFRFEMVSPRGDRTGEWTDLKALPRLVELSVETTGSRIVPPAPIALPLLASGPKAPPPDKAGQPGSSPQTGTPPPPPPPAGGGGQNRL